MAATVTVPRVLQELALTETRHRRAVAAILVVNLHVVRNHPTFGQVYLAIWATTFLMVARDYAKSRKPSRSMTQLLGAWILLGVIGFVSSVSLISFAGSAYGLARFWFALPVFLALGIYTQSSADLKLYIAWLVLFYAFAVATIPLQTLTGSISWFHDETIRGGLARYPSMLGGLNAAGGSVGLYMLLGVHLPRPINWFIPPFIAGCVAIDLSKSGIVSIVSAALIIGWMQRSEATKLVPSLLGGGLAFGGLLYLLPDAESRLSTSLLSFGIQTSEGLRNSDSNVVASGLDRLWRLPLQNWDQWLNLSSGPVDEATTIVFGGGFGMASTALVPRSDSLASQAHNQYAEALSVFGVLGFSLLAAVLIGVLWGLSTRGAVLRSAPGLRLSLRWAVVLLLGRFIFANGGLYHPATASVLFICMFASAWVGEDMSVSADSVDNLELSRTR